MHRMFLVNDVSDVFEQLTAIMAELAEMADIRTAVLSTEDGLSIQRIAPSDPQLAAIAGFMLTTAQQAFSMMGLDAANEVVIRSQDRQMIVCRSFMVSGSRAILTIVFKQQVSYETLVEQTIAKIRQAMEK